HQARDRIRPRHAGIPCSLVPHHHRKKDTHAVAMEVGDHLLHAGNTTGHAANHVVLISVVNSHVRVSWPDQNRINTAVAFLEVVEVSVYGVLPWDGIIEEPILHHHLGLHKT